MKYAGTVALMWLCACGFAKHQQLPDWILRACLFLAGTWTLLAVVQAWRGKL